MRNEFEKNVIHKKIIERVRFSEKDNQYLPRDALSKVDISCADSVNIGWVSYQYQQNKIEGIRKQRDSFIKAYDIELDERIALQNKVNLLTEALDIKEQLNQKLREREDEIHAKKEKLQNQVDEVTIVLDGLKRANYMSSRNKAYNSFLIEKLEKALGGVIE